MSIAISCVIPTVRSDEVLARTVESVLLQDFGEDFEVIVINDAGYDNLLDYAAWHDDPRVKIITSNKVERCFARNLGAAIARGKYLHFLDDDDVVLPGAYKALFKCAENSNAVWTYGSYNCLDDNFELIEIIRPDLEGDIYAYALADIGIPGGASIILRCEFLSAGGFDPKLIPGQDRDLIKRLAKISDFACSKEIVASFRVGPQGRTTTPWQHVNVTSRLMRDKQFLQTDTVARAFCSLKRYPKERGVLCGRISRYYFESSLRHLKTSPSVALSRFFVGSRFTFSGIFRRGFVRGMRGKW